MRRLEPVGMLAVWARRRRAEVQRTRSAFDRAAEQQRAST